MADQTPNIFPSMRFADADAALEWLSRAFGFQQRAVYRDDQGAIRHAEMSFGAGTIMFGQGDPGVQGVYVAVEDADADYERAKAAGAEITRDIEDTPYGSREYSTRDLDGHAWSFGTYRPEPAA
ncbi:MAG: VOC family protein [Solirubrobacteraceae bacterium]